MSQRDLHNGARRDRRRKQTTLREKEQRDEMERFQTMNLMMQKPTGNGATSSFKAELADLNARIAVIEAELAQGYPALPAKGDTLFRALAALALFFSLATAVVLAAVLTKGKPF